MAQRIQKSTAIGALVVRFEWNAMRDGKSSDYDGRESVISMPDREPT
jgi:hypothetical protein